MLTDLWENITDAFIAVQATLFEHVVQPITYAVGLSNYTEDAFNATAWFMAGILQVVFLLLILRPFEKLKPVEQQNDRRAVRADIIYTLIHRLGAFQLFFILAISPAFDRLFGIFHQHGWAGLQLDQMFGVANNSVFSFALYLIIFDVIGYFIHRAQHTYRWWWSLHSLHHSQRTMTMWSDDRNHLIDDFIQAVIFTFIGEVIGVAPDQFIAIICITQLIQSVQHANIKVSFGAIGERLLVSPRFHRVHHGVAIGHEQRNKPNSIGGSNFSVLFPWWDILFKTANFDNIYPQTGVRDQIEKGREYGRGFFEQQWLGCKRLWTAITH